jgi:benzoyl-CoA reductase subunit C
MVGDFPSFRRMIMGVEEILSSLGVPSSDPYCYAEQWKKNSRGKVLAHLLPDVPAELIHASGALPFAITNMHQGNSPDDSHLPSFTCPILKIVLKEALQGNLDFIDGMVIPYVCDATRAFSHVWEITFPHLFNHCLWLPKKVEENSSKIFLYQEFLRMKRRLEDFTGHSINVEDIKTSIRLYNENRKLLRELWALRKKGSATLTYSAFAAIVKTSMVMPKQEHTRILMKLLPEVRKQEMSSLQGDTIKIALLGTLSEHASMAEYLESLGFTVEIDNFYDGSRSFLHDMEETADPLESLVNWRLKQDPLSCFHYSREYWKSFITRRIKGADIRGVIYLVPRYCEFMEFDYPPIAKALQDLQMPILFLETDLLSDVPAQLKTRIEAFAEMLREEN